MSLNETTSSSPSQAESSAESLYNTLLQTAQSYIRATDFSPLITPNYTHAWGHNDYISTRPHLRETLDRDAFFAHLRASDEKIVSIRTEITDSVVDTVQKKVMIRASYFIRAKGVTEEEEEENDLIWIFRMTEDGKKIEAAIEFVDGDWSGRLSAKVALGKAREKERLQTQ